jgi:trans-aconitate 2-methyltransferase
LIPKDMIHPGKEQLMAWIRTTWLPYTQRVSIGYRDEFVDELASKYIENYPPDSKGHIHIDMVRLEVEAEK